METVTNFIFLGSKTTADGDCSHEIKRCWLLGRKAMINLDSILKSRDITFPKEVCVVKVVIFPVEKWMWQLDHKESWVPKNWCFWTVVLEKTLESSLNWKEIKPVNPQGNQPWIFIGRTDAKAPILWPPDAKNWLIGKDPDAGKDWGWEEKGTTEDEMVGWLHSLTRWTWVWVNYRSWWWTEKPGVLQSMGLQRVRHNWATELNYCLTSAQLTVLLDLLKWDSWAQSPRQAAVCTL